MDEEHAKWLVQLWDSPERWAIVMSGGWAAYYNALAATTLPTLGAEVALVGTIGLPAITMVGVFAALGSGYAAARDAAREENSASGFSHGFITGILGWEWRHTASRFGRRYLVINQWDEAMDVIRVKYYNGGLKAGHAAGAALTPAARKAYLTRVRGITGAQVPGGWSARSDDWSERMRAQQVQTSYVIRLAAAARQSNIIKPE